MRGRNLNMIAFILICGMIAYYDLKQCKKLPWPPRFIFAALTFLIMDLMTLVDETLAGVTSIGFVVAVALNTFSPTAPPAGSLKILRECEHGVPTTGQPQNAVLIGDSTGNVGSGNVLLYNDQSQQSSQPAQIPGTTLA